MTAPTEKSGYLIEAGTKQGRLAPASSSYKTPDGAYCFVLGSTSQQEISASLNDGLVLSQDFEFDGSFNLLSLDAQWLQSLDLPVRRDLAGHTANSVWVHTATLKRHEVYGTHQPVARAALSGPYTFPAGTWYLAVKIDGGPEQDVPITAGSYTLAELVTEINENLSLGVAIETDPENVLLNTLGIRSPSSGLAATVEVCAYGTPAEDANTLLNFPVRVVYGGDNLSALEAPDANLADYEVGDTVTIGSSALGNNGDYTIFARDGELLFLNPELTASETGGFTAFLQARRWRLRLLIDSVVIYEHVFELGEVVRTEDLAINVSKLSGTHNVAIAIDLCDPDALHIGMK
jgi:hypothetical protein